MVKYSATKVLGRGGMGIVYLGERNQDGIKQRVAVKVLTKELENTEAVRRFRQERRILASLEHPNIARLLDGGRTKRGQSLLVMEYIDGESIVEYCDTRQVSVRPRIEIFVKVCEALAYAHQRLIVHRDIKPSNVLVTGDGVPKLVDFGIAKPLNGLTGRDDLMQTGTGVQVMTPHYASPEQILFKPVTTATDIYGSGVLLFELLTGHSPYASPGETRYTGSEFELMSTIVDRGAVTPSSILLRRPPTGRSSHGLAPHPDRKPGENMMEVARQRGEPSARSLARKLKGDLDNILLKALAKDPAARYVSIEAMADDLRRYLTGEPVRARPDSVSYRMAKFVRRNPWPVAAATGAVLFSLTLAAVMSWQAGVIAMERDRARIAETKAQEEREKTELAYRSLERDSYVATIESADDSFDTGLNEFAVSTLERAPVALRNWEWGWLVEPPRDLRQKRQPVTLRTSHYGGVRALYFGSRQQHMLSAGLDGKLKLWSWPSGVLVATFGAALGTHHSAADGGVVAFAPHPRQESVFALTADGRVVVWDLATRTPTEVRAVGGWHVTAFAGTANQGEFLAAGTFGGEVVLWDAVNERVTRVLPGTGIPVTAITIDRTGAKVIAGFESGRTRVWDMNTGGVLMTLDGHTRRVTAVSVSPDGTRLITGGADHIARLWDLETGKELIVIVGHEKPLTVATFSPDGERVLTAGLDGEVKVSEPTTGKELIGLDEEHGLHAVHSLAYSPDGRTIAVGDATGAVSWFTAHPWWNNGDAAYNNVLTQVLTQERTWNDTAYGQDFAEDDSEGDVRQGSEDEDKQ